MKARVIAVVGGKKSGKTTTVESLIRELTKRGYKVAAIKHVSESDFTIDTPGKDTWRFAQAGARTIISVAASETATIEKTPIENLSLCALLKKCGNNDIVLIEGLKRLVAKNERIPKIVTTKSPTEAAKAPETFRPILAFSGSYSTTTSNPEIPYADALLNPEKLATIIENRVFRK